MQENVDNYQASENQAGVVMHIQPLVTRNIQI